LVGDIFSDEHNPGRKKPFEIRRVMLAASDQDYRPLERWAGMEDAENAVVWDAHIGGIPVCLLGFESRPLPRTGFVPTDGPEQWTSGTLFPMASKKIARAINASTNNRPLVILANLSGFDGSPESMRLRQLEFGAEIGRVVAGEHLDSDRVQYLQVPWFRITSAEPMMVNVDGESTALRQARYDACPRDLLIHLPRLPGHRRSVERDL
jgi:hypothetical protein